MVVDTSAIIAVIFNEPETDTFVTKIVEAQTRFASTATLLEATAVLQRQTKSRDDRELDTFIVTTSLQVVAFDDAQLEIARRAYRQYGRRSGHPARLNFGDCFAYALAKHFDMPLLFKGNDFGLTDVSPA